MTSPVEPDESRSTSGATVLAFPVGAVEFYTAMNSMLDARERYEVAHDDLAHARLRMGHACAEATIPLEDAHAIYQATPHVLARWLAKVTGHRDAEAFLATVPPDVEPPRDTSLAARFRAADDHTSFVAGYTAAMDDLGGGSTMIRSEIMWSDPASAADNAYNASGEDWMADGVQRQLEEAPARPAPSESAPRPQGVVYVMGDQHGRVKIGWTGQNVQARRRQIEMAGGRDLDVLATFAGSRADECAAHDLFAADRLKGEWFTRTSAIDAWIAEHRP